MLAVQIFAMGAKYFRDEWNLMDGSIVVTSVTADVLGLLSVRGSALSSLRVLRALRALRPLRLIPRAPGLKRVVNAMIRGLPPVLNVAVVVLVFFLIFRCVASFFMLNRKLVRRQKKGTLIRRKCIMFAEGKPRSHDVATARARRCTAGKACVLRRT